MTAARHRAAWRRRAPRAQARKASPTWRTGVPCRRAQTRRHRSCPADGGGGSASAPSETCCINRSSAAVGVTRSLRVPRRLLAGEHLAGSSPNSATAARTRAEPLRPRPAGSRAGSAGAFPRATGCAPSGSARGTTRAGRGRWRGSRPARLVAHAVREDEGLDHAHVVVELDDRLGRGVAIRTAKPPPP